MAVFKAGSRFRLLLVTFDLTRTTPGDRRYAEADEALSLHGELFKPVKQLRFLITSQTSARIKASLEQRVGRSSSIVVIPLTSLPAWRIYGRQKQEEWQRFVAAVRARGIPVVGLNERSDSAT